MADEVVPDLSLVPTGLIIQPCDSLVPRIQAMEDWEPGQWDHEFNKCIEATIDARQFLVTPIPARLGMEFPATYDFPQEVLPNQRPRSLNLYAIDIWNWVYHCRRVYAPFQQPHMKYTWPYSYSCWAGPDGMIIHRYHEPFVIASRKELLAKQKLKSAKSKGRKEIGILAHLPLIKVLPDVIGRPPT